MPCRLRGVNRMNTRPLAFLNVLVVKEEYAYHFISLWPASSRTLPFTGKAVPMDRHQRRNPRRG